MTMRWAQEQRLSFIGERLLDAGAINRSDLIERFRISAPQAATDFRIFNEKHPGVMRYDNHRKAYVPDRITVRQGRDIFAAAKRLMAADDDKLLKIIRHDPSMIRDVAAALIARCS